MRFLLDAHVLIWALDDASKLSDDAANAITTSANELLLGAGTIWELSIKVGLGKLGLSLPFRRWIEQAVNDLNIATLPISIEHADVQVALPLHHRDPFDRLLVAQATGEQATIISNDAAIDAYGIDRLW